MSERYDIAIIGSGPAGLSAALNARIRNKKFIVFGNKNLSAKAEKAHQINNYLGFYNISGQELNNQFAKHIEAMDIEIQEEKITMVYAMGDYYSLMGEGNVYEATSVILATGVNFGKPLKGEEAFLGRGVSYCATCDAALYRGKTVAIIGHSPKEEAEAQFMSEVAAKVYYIPIYKEEVQLGSEIEIVNDLPVEIKGEQTVKSLELKNGSLQVDGVFILKEAVSPAQLVPGIKMDGNHVEVDRKMKTNLAGCFAAGDIVGTPYQFIKSAGEGNIASLSAVSYIDELKRKSKES